MLIEPVKQERREQARNSGSHYADFELVSLNRNHVVLGLVLGEFVQIGDAGLLRVLRDVGQADTGGIASLHLGHERLDGIEVIVEGSLGDISGPLIFVAVALLGALRLVRF